MLAIQLKQNLNTVKSAYCVAGDDAYLREQALSALRALAGEELAEFNVTELDGGSTGVSDIVACFSQVPFMADRRVVVVRDFTQTLSDDDYEMLGNAIYGADDAVLVFYYSGQVSQQIKKLCEYVDCDKLKDAEVKDIVSLWCSERGYVIDSSALYKLISYTSCDLMRITNELEKLYAYCSDTRAITDTAVGEVVSRDMEFVVFALSNAVSERRSKDAYAILDEAKGDIGKNLGMLTTLINQFRRTLHVLLNKGDDRQALAKYLGISEYAVSRTLTLAKKYKPAKLKAIVDKFEEVEYLFKSGKILTTDEALFIGVTFALENS